MAERNVSVRLSANVGAYIAAMKAAEASTTKMAGVTQAQMTRVGAQMQNVGRRMTTFVSLPIVAAGAAAVVAAVNWESAWAGVTKTVDGTTEQLAELEEGLRAMAKEIPATHGEIAAVAEAAGALGVATADIEFFTRVMLDLGETTDLSSDAAATAIAQLMNVMQTAPGDVDNLGAALVHLGNNGASTESQILDMASGIAGAGAIVGLQEHEVLSFANALASMGIEAEAGGSSFSRVITDMSKAVSQGGDKLEIFAQVAGMSASQFATAFRADPAAAIVSFIDGLGGIHAAGGDVFTVLDGLGLSGIRVSRSLLTMTTSGDLLTNSLNEGASAWEANTALADEAAKRYDTAGARFEIVRNKIVDLFIDLGEMMLPAVEAVVGVIGQMAEKFQALPAPVQAAVGGFLALLAAIGPIVFIAGSFIKHMTSIQAAMTKFGPAASTASKALGAIGIAAAVGFVGYQMFTAEQRKAEENTRQATEALDTQFFSLMGAAIAAGHAAGEIDSVAIANEALSRAIAEGNEELADAAAQLNIGASELLDVFALMDADGESLVTTIDYLGRSFGLTAEQADYVANNYGRLANQFGMVDQAAVDGAAALGINADQLGVVTQAMRDFLGAADDQSMQDITREFLNARVEASNYEDSLVAAAEAQAGTNRQTGDAIAVYRAYAEQVATASAEELTAAGISEQMASAIAGVDAALAGVGPAAEGAADGIGELEKVAASSIDTMTDFQDAWEFAETRINAFREGLERAVGTGGQWIRAHDSFQSALLGFNEQIDHSTHGLDFNTEAGLANRSAVMDMADELIRLTETNIDSGMSQSEVTADYLAGREALLDAAEAAGLNRDEVEDLIDAYGAVPTLVSTAVQLMGHALAQWRIERYIEQLDEIPAETATLIEAAIDAGDMEEAQRLLNSLSGHAIISAEVRPKAWRGSVSTNAGTSMFSMGMSAAAKGAFVRGGTNQGFVTGDVSGRRGDEVILPLGDPNAMAGLLGLAEVGPRVAAAFGHMMPVPALAAVSSSPSPTLESRADLPPIYVYNQGNREITPRDIAAAIRQSRAAA